jgi:hypothetical protein
MSKLSRYAPLLIAASFLLPLAAAAQVTIPPVQGTPNSGQATSIVTQVTNVARLVITLLFVLSFLVFVWGAVKLILAAGNPEKIGEAKGFMWWSVIAMAVLASVFGLVTFLQSYFGVTGGGGFNNTFNISPTN